MAKRKTFAAMTFAQRVAVRREMLKEAEFQISHNFPAMPKGAVKVKAYKFVEESIQKEMQNGRQHIATSR